MIGASVIAGATRGPTGFVTDGLEALYKMEIERRNLLTHSEDFGEWVARDSVVTGNTAIGPFGRQLADRVQATGANAYVMQNVGIELRAGVTYTFSVYVRVVSGGTASVRIGFHDGTTPGSLLGSGTVCNLTEEWERYETTYTAASSGSASVLIGGGGSFDSVSDDDILVYGAQINEGSTALPYVPTSNKRAVYDYSGKGNHAHLGSAGVAFINPAGGPKALNLPGEGSNYASTPDSAAVSVTGDLDIRCHVTLDDYSTGVRQALVSKWSGYIFHLHEDDRMLLTFRAQDATVHEAGSAPFQPTPGEEMWLRATLDLDDGAGSYRVRFYKSDDGAATWTEVSALTGPGPALAGLLDSGQAVGVGARNDADAHYAKGKIHRAQVYDGIDGTLVADFNAEDAHGDVTQFYSSTTGELWTINQGAATTNDPTWTGEGLDFDGVDDYVKAPGTAIRTALNGAAGQSLTVVVDPTGSPSHEGLVDEYHGLIGFARPALQFRTFTSQPGAGYFIRGDLSMNGGNYDTLYYLPAEEDGPVMYAMDASTETDVHRNFRNGVLVDTETDVADITSLGTTGSFLHIGAIDDTVGGISTPSEMPTLMAAVYSRALTEAEYRQNFYSARRMLAQRGVSL